MCKQLYGHLPDVRSSRNNNYNILCFIIILKKNHCVTQYSLVIYHMHKIHTMYVLN